MKMIEKAQVYFEDSKKDHLEVYTKQINFILNGKYLYFLNYIKILNRKIMKQVYLNKLIEIYLKNMFHQAAHLGMFCQC